MRKTYTARHRAQSVGHDHPSLMTYTIDPELRKFYRQEARKQPENAPPVSEEEARRLWVIAEDHRNDLAARASLTRDEGSARVPE